eukprot:gene20621-40456_t
MGAGQQRFDVRQERDADAAGGAVEVGVDGVGHFERRAHLLGHQQRRPPADAPRAAAASAGVQPLGKKGWPFMYELRRVFRPTEWLGSAIMLDDLDRRLIALLRADSRTPAATLAKSLKVSRGTVQNRVDRLLNRGFIQGFT